MTSHNGRSGNGTGDLDLLRAEIRQTRAELGQTVQALAAKTDVKSRLRLGADRARLRLRDSARQAAATARRPDRRTVAVPALVVAGTVVTVVLVWLTRRGRRG
ncbi:DUF3618 domain-containing protein [Solwaraspora sp. WMMD792]|uniref:DUF3618 domain-containing protein n=1 Tax=unclassified Solwaraspora TaxID=2627926 RepID=UPI0024177970|nr:DUF3618 domain-containing protein [Solwaraspora sp. WMMD792]MDG4770439.1 DUF3618 domain-containing protein [Solwaraspora sp. WMMD792]